MRFILLACAAAALIATSCGSSHAADPGDAAITFDAMPDAGPRDAGPRDARVARCGDSVLDPMEGCDDGNTTDGDGCNATCRREAFCGNGMMEMGEICDDGNNRSGDGCRSDCQSNEVCGNGVRDLVRGEACDDGNLTDGDGCSALCLLEGCGDGMLDPAVGEACDDGNTTPWDGCASDCLVERSMVMSEMEIGEASQGCDYTGDGRPDNALGAAFGAGLGFLNMQLMGGITDGSVIMLMSFMGLDDRTGTNDPSLRVAWAQGEDSDGDASNNLGGMGTFYGTMDAFNPDGTPTTSFESNIVSRMLSGGPEDIELPLGFILPLELKQGRVHGTTNADTAGDLSGIESGLLCGAVPLGTLALLPNFIAMFGGGSMGACDGATDSGSLADVLVGGASVLGFVMIGPAMPDVDLDGDGLEAFEVDADGPDGCQAVITACIDGDGTRIEGRNCALDPRIGDGYSTGLPFTAVHATILGIR